MRKVHGRTIIKWNAKNIANCFLHQKDYFYQLKPYVAASLDNIRSCSFGDDCPDVVVEYKCPWKHQNLTPKKAFVTPEICGEKVKDKFLLKTSSRYYCQIQLQMFVAELDACDFVVWTKEGILSVSSSVASPKIQSCYANMYVFIDCENNQFLKK